MKARKSELSEKKERVSERGRWGMPKAKLVILLHQEATTGH